MLFAKLLEQGEAHTFLFGEDGLYERVKLIVITDHDEFVSQQDWTNGQRFRDLTRFIHNAEVELETEQQVVVHLEASGAVDVVCVQGVLDLSHRLKHLVRAHVTLDDLVGTCDVVSHPDEVVEPCCF